MSCCGDTDIWMGKGTFVWCGLWRGCRLGPFCSVWQSFAVKLTFRVGWDDLWNLVCFSSYVCLWLSPPSSPASFLFSVLWWKRFLRCSPFDEFKLWKSQVDNGSKKGGERLNILTRTLLLRRTKDQLDSAGKPLVIPLTLVAGWMWGVRKEGDRVLDSACTAIAFASGAPGSPMLLHRGPWVAVLPPGS